MAATQQSFETNNHWGMLKFIKGMSWENANVL